MNNTKNVTNPKSNKYAVLIINALYYIYALNACLIRFCDTFARPNSA